MARRLLGEKIVRRAVIKYLGRKGYARGLEPKETQEHGVDIKVCHNKYPRYFYVEVKGESDAKSARASHEVYFLTALGQILTRMKSKSAYKYGLGFPQAIADKAVRRIPWHIAKKLRLHIFSVDDMEKVSRLTWKELKKTQELKKSQKK
jgi:hypothetical protein